MKKLTAFVLMTVFVCGVLRSEETETEPTPAPEATPEETTPAAEATPATPAAEVPVVQSEDAAAIEGKIGSEVIVEGVVRNVGTGPNGNITFLNFGDRQTGFVAVVFRAAYDKFPEGFDKYGQQKVRVRGSLEKYRDRQPQIKIFTPDQIEIVASEAP